ncbi:MAG TPA: hypothetical protein VIK32_12195 [Candidatus Limnocylindrales bacterium]|jgi:hypothetical protein
MLRKEILDGFRVQVAAGKPIIDPAQGALRLARMQQQIVSTSRLGIPAT